MKIGLMDVKKALKDPRFRDALPPEAREDVIKFLQNPNCACNVPIYRNIIQNYSQYLMQYFPGAEIIDEKEEIRKLAENHWIVINCHISELEKRLSELPPGRKNLAVARYQDQVTVVVDQLDEIF